MRKLAWEFEVVLTYVNLQEIISTTSTERRRSLIDRFKRLLRPGRCLIPPGEIVRQMISAHVKAPGDFDWMNVDVGMPQGFEDLMSRRDYLDEEFCTDQRIEQREVEKRFRQSLKSLRPALDEIPVSDRPASFEEFVTMEADGKPLWDFGPGIYYKASGVRLADPEIKDFMKRCPPFHALCLGQTIGSYDWSLGRQQGPKNQPAGRNDLMMAVYMPYCDQFVTNDSSQREALREVASKVQMPCQVLSFDEFAQAVSG